MKLIKKILLLAICSAVLWMVYEIPILASSYGISDLNIDAPNSYILEENQAGEIEISFSGMGIDSVGVYTSNTELKADIVRTSWNPYPNICSATLTIFSEGNFSEGLVTFYLFNNNLGIIKSESISISVTKSETEVSDLSISVFDTYEFVAGCENRINVDFKGKGIDRVGIEISDKDIVAELSEIKWNQYPETCFATIILPASNKVNGSITFNLINNNLGVVHSQTIWINYKTSELNYGNLNIDVNAFHSVEIGKSNEINVKFSGQGISDVDLAVSGEGLTAELTNVSWKGYPEICLATIAVKASKQCNEGGIITFQLINESFGVIKSQDIHVKTYDNSIKQENDELNEAVLSSGYYVIYSGLDKNKVLDVSGISKEDKAQIQIWSKYGTFNQIWYLSKDKDGYYSIYAAHSIKYVDVAGGESSSGTTVWQYSKNDTDAQKWKIYSAGDGYVYISPKCAPELFLDVKNGSSKNGAEVQVYNRNYTNAQKWKFEFVTRAKNDVKPITFKGGMIIDSEFDVPKVSDVQEAIRSDLEEMHLDNLGLKNINNFRSFLDELDGISQICKQIPDFPGNLEVPQALALEIRKNNFKNLNGLRYVIEDDNIRITYITYVYHSENNYNFAIFQVTEKRTWNNWRIDKIGLKGGFAVKVL